jgi:hypothetical protein
MRKHVIDGYNCPPVMVGVRVKAFVKEYFMWPILIVVQQPGHVLDMAPVYQVAVKQLRLAAADPQSVVDGTAKLLPDTPQCYPQHTNPHSRGYHDMLDMQRIRQAVAGDEVVNQWLGESLAAIADKFFDHTQELQEGGIFAGACNAAVCCLLPLCWCVQVSMSHRSCANGSLVCQRQARLWNKFSA